MQADDVRLGQVFANDQQNVIPLFQRPYVWDEEDNWEPLWQDIRQAAEEVELEVATGNHLNDPRTYFLGAVVLQQRRKPPQRVASWSVIDGQQRLTTLQILFAAARSVAHGIGADTLASKFASMIENRSEIVHEKYPDDRYKVWPLPQDRDVFLWAVRHHSDVTVAPNPRHRIVRARTWFETTIKEWASESDDPEERLEYLHETLKERMELVQITLEANDDPQVIFEVLNHRGVPLGAADLVKNLLFQALDSSGHHSIADQLLMESWLPLDQEPWRDEVTTGRVRRILIDLLLSYWLTIRSGTEVLVDHLFVDFKKWMAAHPNDAGEVIRSIRHYADTMTAMRSLPPHDPTAQLIDRMESTQTTTPWPTLLYLQAEETIPLGQRQIATKAIDSFLMRRAICRLPQGDYSRLFLQVLTVAKTSDPLEVGKVIEALLASQTAESRRWPTDLEFSRALLQPDLFRVIVRARLKSFLVGVENFLRTEKTETSSLLQSTDTKLNIEHLLPQTWQETWALPVEADETTILRREAAVHKLGNLTLLTVKLNPSVSNNPWPLKRKEIQKHSLLRLTTSSVLSAPDTTNEIDEYTWSQNWDEDRIDIRGNWLAKQALLLWRRPTETSNDLNTPN